MSLLKSLVTDQSIANEKDSLGGSQVLESGLYPAKITLAYVTKAASEALGLVIEAKTEIGQTIRETVYMTSGKAKGCTNYYTDKDGKKQYLPGFILCNALALLTVGKEISEIDTEEKVVKVYNSEAKAEVPTKVQMLTELLGQDILIGLVKQVVDKTKKNEATGAYDPTGETREQNTIDKLFRASDRKTTTEIRAQDEATFVNKWAEKNTGVTQNRASKTAGTAGAPKAAGSAFGAAAAAPKKSLFGAPAAAV